MTQRTRISIDFQRGERFDAELFDEQAPKSVAILKAHLPFAYTFFQSVVSGHALVCLPPDLTLPRENQRVAGVDPGTISFLVKDEPVLVPDEIYLSYGIFISRGLTVDMKQPVNIVGRVLGDLDAWRTACRRVHMEGAQTIRFTLAS